MSAHDLVADRRQRLVAQAMSAHGAQQFMAHHFHHPRSPVRLPPGGKPSVLCQPRPEFVHCLFQFFDAGASGGDGSDHGRNPASVLRRQRLHRSHFFFHPVGAVAIALVDHENIGNLHNAGLDALHIVAHAGHQHNDGDVGQAHDVDFILADAHGFEQQALLAAGLDHGGNIRRGAGEAAQRAAGRHAAHVEAGIGIVLPHADAIAQDGSAGVGAGGVDGNHSDGRLLRAVSASEPIDQRALTGAGRAGDADAHRGAAIGKAAGKNLPRGWRVIFHQRNCPRQRAYVSLAHAPDQLHDVTAVDLHPSRSYDCSEDELQIASTALRSGYKGRQVIRIELVLRDDMEHPSVVDERGFRN